MAKKSKKPHLKRSLIKRLEDEKAEIDESEAPKWVPEFMSVSFQYFDHNAECFSNWEKRELEKLSVKLKHWSKMTANQIIRQNKIHTHEELSIPSNITPDIEKIHSIPLSLGTSDGKLRVHGVFVGSIFFLLRLDRRHKVCPV